jgi:hypothetical protein
VFSGTIPGPLRSMIRESAAKWPRGTDVWIGCSGNFTIERTLADMGFRLHGNDVSIYTCALGAYFTGAEFEMTLNPDEAEPIEWLAPYLGDTAAKVATLILCTRFLADVDKEGGYFERNVRAYRDQFPRLHAETKTRIEAMTLRLESYHPKDVREYLADDVPEDGIVVSFPPFYKGGYEKLYAAMDRHFLWDKPVYEMLDLDDVVSVLDTMTTRPTWILATNHEDEDRADHLRGFIQPNVKAAPFWVYASDANARIVHAETKVEPVFIPRFGPDDVITEDSRISLTLLKPGQFESLRQQYLNKGIGATSTDVVPYAVRIDGKMIGLIGLGSFKGPNMIMLMTDFAVPGTAYPRLSKLVVAAALSTEARMSMERSWTRSVRTMTSAVFTNNPVSMKYRGLFDIRNREELPPGENFKYKITYESEAGRWSLAEALSTWLRTNGQRRDPASRD